MHSGAEESPKAPEDNIPVAAESEPFENDNALMSSLKGSSGEKLGKARGGIYSLAPKPGKSKRPNEYSASKGQEISLEKNVAFVSFSLTWDWDNEQKPASVEKSEVGILASFAFRFALGLMCQTSAIFLKIFNSD